jgi:hypothetical protein
MLAAYVVAAVMVSAHRMIAMPARLERSGGIRRSALLKQDFALRAT